MQAALEAEGIRFALGARVASVHRPDTDGPVEIDLGAGGTVVADEILVATGRRPRTRELGLDTVGLPPGGPIDVDERQRVSGIPDGWLYAVGDCTGLAPLTHMGKYQARIAADVILGKDAADRASRDMVPRVTFTDPQVCAVGLTEAAAIERGLPVRTVEYGTGDVAGSYTRGEGLGGTSKLVVDSDREVVVGATFTGHGVQELLHSATVAIAGQVSVHDLWHAVPSFPTVSEVWLRLLEAYGL